MEYALPGVSLVIRCSGQGRQIVASRMVPRGLVEDTPGNLRCLWSTRLSVSATERCDMRHAPYAISCLVPPGPPTIRIPRVAGPMVWCRQELLTHHNPICTGSINAWYRKQRCSDHTPARWPWLKPWETRPPAPRCEWQATLQRAIRRVTRSTRPYFRSTRHPFRQLHSIRSQGSPLEADWAGRATVSHISR
ncbi:hypothetical protein L227DRAFT_106870 [Lentinus tigrinus ALCF2SS1-6]|uniref:Uncharacterized protein n=1 Tax=Lentinus tigrinus ALCF2SS1-6 TaxID=1328759 RepID=A0A5C2S8I8_9APHY|nr:hypothetical protein L227DRAFT_106870 [Lentinus tigrinus ALCF2SS1-6]